LYIDDFIFSGDISIDDFKTMMKKDINMTNLWMMKYFLGIEIAQFEVGIFIFQSKYEKGILKRFRMVNCNQIIM